MTSLTNSDTTEKEKELKTTYQKPSSTTPDATENELLQIPLLRALVADTPDPDHHLLHDAAVLRFLRARPTLETAAAMLRHHLIWRQETKPWQTICPACDDTPGYHALRQVGFDQAGRPIIYTCFVQCADGTGIQNGAEHLTFAIENAIHAMKAYYDKHHQQGDGKWVWMLDYAGFGLKNMGLASSKKPLALLQSHYPERLHKVVMLNAPWIFGGFFAMLKPFVDARTYAKAAFVRGSREEVEKGLLELGIVGDVVPWLLDEMSANRTSPQLETQRQFWRKPTEAGGHDPRGAPSWVQDYLENRKNKTIHPIGCCVWKSGLPNPDIVRDLTGGLSVEDHYVCWEEEDIEWYRKRSVGGRQSDQGKKKQRKYSCPSTSGGGEQKQSGTDQ